MGRGLAAVVAVLALSGPALAADPLAGSWYGEGEHSKRGAFTSEIRISARGSGRYLLRGRYELTAGGRLSWTARGKLEGDRLQVRYRTVVGLSGRLERRRTIVGHGSYRLQRGILQGGWRAPRRFAVTETLATGDSTEPDAEQEKTPEGIKVDLDLVRPGGGLVPEAQELSTGLPVAVNLDDDDGDGGRGGDGETHVVRDHQDPNGVPGEDDLIEIRVRAPERTPRGAHYRLRFGRRVAVWRDAEKRLRVQSKATELEPKARSLWVEGRTASEAGAGETIELELVRDGEVLGRDAVRVHVTRSAFLLVGHGGTGDWVLPRRLGARAVDTRRDPAIVKGSDRRTGRVLYWAVYIWRTEKLAKIALSTEGAAIAYDGHSNFGLGFSFDTHLRTVRQFMNIAEAQVPISWEYLRDHQEHPELQIREREYGDDRSTKRRFDPVAINGSVRGVLGRYSTQRYPPNGARGGIRCSLTRGKRRWQDYHFGAKENRRLVVKAGARDMPRKRWSALFLNSCYAGPYYLRAFGGRGTLFFTHEEASSPATSAIFLLGFVDGKSDALLLKELNAEENVNDYVVFGE